MRKRNYIKTGQGSQASFRKRLAVGAGIAATLYLLVSFIFGEMGVVKYYRMKSQHNDLVKEISKLKQDNTRLIRDVHALKSDPVHLELVARDKLGLARPGEIVYYYGEP